MKAGEGPPRAYMPQFDGGETGPSLDADAILSTLQKGGANYKTPVVAEGKNRDDAVLVRWQKLAGIKR